MSNQETDKALLQQAKQEINDGDWLSAVTACQSMTPTATADREFAYVCASAYAGRCRLDFLALITALDGYTLGTPDFMLFLLQMRRMEEISRRGRNSDGG